MSLLAVYSCWSAAWLLYWLAAVRDITLYALPPSEWGLGFYAKARASGEHLDRGRSLLQILHYQFGERYEPHWDYFVDPVNAVNGGQRLATMLIYLSDVEEGGETVFPSSEEKPARATPA